MQLICLLVLPFITVCTVIVYSVPWVAFRNVVQPYASWLCYLAALYDYSVSWLATDGYTVSLCV